MNEPSFDGCAPEQAALAQAGRVSSTWLGLREAADATARAAELVPSLRSYISDVPCVVVHDLGCGTGSMRRWLAPQLPGRQHWIMYDRDADLLQLASADTVGKAADGLPVTVETRQCDISRLTADDLGRCMRSPDEGCSDCAGLVTASALLDLLTLDEVERIVAACVSAGLPALLTVSVVGRVDLTPPDPLDPQVATAFNAHQRRTIGDRRLLGPHAVDATLDAFTRRGTVTAIRPSAWRLGADNVDLMSEWFVGWLGAACEQRPELTPLATGYARRRLAEVADGRLGVVVHHRDLLAGVNEP